MNKVYRIPGSPLDIVNETQNWDSIILDFDEAGKGVVLVDEPMVLGYVDANLDDKAAHDFLVTNKDKEFFAKMTQAAQSKLGTLNEGAGGAGKSGVSSTASKNTVVPRKTGTISYSTTQGVWLTKYSFEPEDICSVFENFLTFKGGLLPAR